MRQNRQDDWPEILAPVGGAEQLFAAVRCGTDAVYFGLQGFNARRNAENFGGDDLQERIDYCHERGVKVYITINTLVFDRELAQVKETVDTACRAGADALIVQDLAVAAYCRKAWPGMRLFTSTQMAIHNEEGIRLAQTLGFSRFVVARELSLKEIRQLYERTGVELEVFVHGAHCMSVSGNCYLSAMIGGRSGNRGLCAQPCRLECSVNGREHALSLKDLSYVERIPELTDRQYRVGGCTALLDAVGSAISHIGNVHKYAREEDRPGKTLFVITTDGMENASRRYTYSKLKEMIERQKEKYGWEFLFLGANIDSAREAGRFGIGRDNCADYLPDSHGTEVIYGAVCEAVSSFRASRPLAAHWKKSIDNDVKSRKR